MAEDGQPGRKMPIIPLLRECGHGEPRQTPRGTGRRSSLYAFPLSPLRTRFVFQLTSQPEGHYGSGRTKKHW